MINNKATLCRNFFGPILMIGTFLTLFYYVIIMNSSALWEQLPELPQWQLPQLLNNGEETMRDSDILVDTEDCSITVLSFFEGRLEESEVIWERWQKKRRAALDTYENKSTISYEVRDLREFWDFFTPAFSCPHTLERIGRLGDGGKWVCGLSNIVEQSRIQMRSCVIYSFGMKDDSSFEQDVLDLTNCIVRMFDPAVEKGEEAIQTVLEKYPGRAFFHKLGLSAVDSPKKNKITLSTAMKTHKDEFVDIVKLDVEGWEYTSLIRILADFPYEIPLGQLLVEFHTSQMPNKTRFTYFDRIWSYMELRGLRAFRSEPNLVEAALDAQSRIHFYEYSFLNLLYERKLIKEQQ